MIDFKDIENALLSPDPSHVSELVKTALSQGKEPREILEKGLIAGMDKVGEKMENEEMFIPEVLMAAKAMTAAVALLKPFLGKEKGSARGRVVIGTVRGDIHDIGKNLVAMMLSGLGFEVFDLGSDISPEAFVNAVKEKDADFLAMSALLTTTMPMMKETIKAVEKAGLRHRVKILVGGAPVTQPFCSEIGADGYEPDAGSAAKRAKSMISG
ncbi:MAG: corrinoid protein [Thermodesulfobacteriota bacterium]